MPFRESMVIEKLSVAGFAPRRRWHYMVRNRALDVLEFIDEVLAHRRHILRQIHLQFDGRLLRIGKLLEYRREVQDQWSTLRGEGRLDLFVMIQHHRDPVSWTRRCPRFGPSFRSGLTRFHSGGATAATTLSMIDVNNSPNG
jgi:hypothetical protein